MVCAKVYKARVFKAKPGTPQWLQVIKILKKRGVNVLVKPEPADVSIVLSGAWENAGLLTGKKILFYNVIDWMESEPDVVLQEKFELYRPILEEYYDEIINLSGMSDKHKASEILKKIDEVNQP